MHKDVRYANQVWTIPRNARQHVMKWLVQAVLSYQTDRMAGPTSLISFYLRLYSSEFGN